MFSSQQNNPESIRKSYEVLAGQPTKIEEELAKVNAQIFSAKQGGCVRPPMSIMGPSPVLEEYYTARKMVLENMLEEAKEKDHSNANYPR